MTSQKIQRVIHKITGALPAFDGIFGRPNPMRGGDAGIRLRTFVSPDVFIITIGAERRRVGDIATAAEMPFTEMSCVVTGRLQHPGERRRIGGQKIGLLAIKILGLVIEIGREIPTRRKHAGDVRAAGRRANRRIIVKMRETDAFSRQPVNIGGGHKFAAITGRIAIPHVIRQNKYDVRPLVRE